VLHGEKWYLAHNKHAYQRAVRSGYTHAKVSSTFAIANVIIAVIAAGTLRATWLLGPAFLLAIVGLGGLYVAIERRLPM
jgi:hypothetical protein